MFTDSQCIWPPLTTPSLVADTPFVFFVLSEFQRIGDALDFEIKRWSAGKEGNLRALLSTLQYVSWRYFCGFTTVKCEVILHVFLLSCMCFGAKIRFYYLNISFCATNIIHYILIQHQYVPLQRFGLLGF